MIWIIIIILLIMLKGGSHLTSKTKFYGTGFILVIISGIILTLGVLLLPVSYYGTKSEIQEYYSVKQTIKEARQADTSEVERATVTQKIIETNQWLASAKYWNNSIFDIYYPDEIESLEPLK